MEDLFNGNGGIATPYLMTFKKIPLVAIKGIIEEPDASFQDLEELSRQVLINREITSKSGKLITVVIETQTDTEYFHVCTAFVNRDPKTGNLLWQKGEEDDGS